MTLLFSAKYLNLSDLIQILNFRILFKWLNFCGIIEIVIRLMSCHYELGFIIFNISVWSETPTISYKIFSHLHRIVIYQKNQSNHRLFLLFNLIRQINRPIRIRQAQILKTAKKWKKNFRKLSKKFLNSKNFWNRRTKGLFF